ncbi:MAG: TIGR04552 family protein, partial [Bacteriovoracia bacterium]
MQPPDRKALDSIYGKYDFRFEVLDVMIGGVSIIDTDIGLSGFRLKTHEDADRFMQSYGFDLADPIERAEALGNFHEAINFVRKYFLQPENPDGLKLEIPRKILEVTDMRDLLLMAGHTYPGQQADAAGQALRAWACSLLKVVHAIAHIDKDVRTPYFSDIQKQIFDRFYKVIHRGDQGELYMGDARIPLTAFETKPKKSRESMLLKVLFKRENVTDEIFDRVGMRIVTPTVLDSLRVVKYLKDSMVVMPANIKASRSRNTLIDLSFFRSRLEELLVMANRGQVGEEALREELLRSIRPPQLATDNPHSSAFYRSIQFTCRQLIKFTNPLFDDIKALKAEAKKENLPDRFATMVKDIDLKYLQREVRFFYPFEVQIMDQKSFEENERG